METFENSNIVDAKELILEGNQSTICGIKDHHEDDFEPKIGIQYYPMYTSDISNGYIPNKHGHYFRAQGSEVTITDNEKAYYVLKNSHRSKHNIFVNTYDFTNLSGTPIKVTLYYCGNLKHDVPFDEQKAVTGNAKCCCPHVIPPGKVLTLDGTTTSPIDFGIPATTFTVPAFETVHRNPKGSIILDKGSVLIAEVSCFCPRDTAYAIACFGWWAEAIERCSTFGLFCPKY